MHSRSEFIFFATIGALVGTASDKHADPKELAKRAKAIAEAAADEIVPQPEPEAAPVHVHAEPESLPVGPTLAEWIAAGYSVNNYPPDGYVVAAEEIASRNAMLDELAMKAAATAPVVVDSPTTEPPPATENPPVTGDEPPPAAG